MTCVHVRIGRPAGGPGLRINFVSLRLFQPCDKILATGQEDRRKLRYVSSPEPVQDGARLGTLKAYRVKV